MFTLTRDTNGSYSVYVDGTLDTGPSQDGIQYQDVYGNPSVLGPLPTTNAYYTTNIYPSAGVSNPPPNGYVRWVFPGMFKSGSTAFGGFKRGSVSAGVPCQIDDIAVWNRALSPAEITAVLSGFAPPPPPPPFPMIQYFKADFAEIASGDQVTLRWSVIGARTNAGGIVISGIGDVTALGPVASTNITLSDSASHTFTMTAHNGINPDETASVVVRAFAGVSSEWHLIQRFDASFTNTTQGIGGNGWLSVTGSYLYALDRWNVITLYTGGASNKALAPATGYTPNPTGVPTPFLSTGAISWGALNALTLEPSQSRTLFFRFSLKDPGPVNGLNSDIDCSIGLTDFNPIGPLKSVGAPGSTGNIGPFIALVRSSGGLYNGGAFDLKALDYGGSSVTNTYSYIASANSNGLQTNVNYCVWMDVQNNNTQAHDNGNGTSNTINEPIYSVWLQKQGEAKRALLFSGFHGNRDYVGFNPGIDEPAPYLDKMFVNIGDEDVTAAEPGAYFATNMVVIDDLYLSKSGFSPIIPKLFDIRSCVRDSSGATLVWDSLASLYQTNTYTVQRKLELSEPAWTTVASVASGGDTTSYADTSGGSSAAFYRITWP